MKKYPFVKQSGLKDCGVCCLKMIITYYKGNYPIEKLRELTNTTRDGTSAYDLIEGAKKIGFDAVGYRTLLKDIQNEILPAIAYTVVNQSFQHYVVIYEMNPTKDEIIIADPANKIQKMSLHAFQAIYQNVLIVLTPLHHLPMYQENNIIQKVIKESINKKYCIKIFIFMFLSITLSSLLSIQSKVYLDFVEQQNSISFLPFLFLFIMGLKYFLDKIKNTIFLKHQKQMDTKLYNTVLKHIILLPYQYYRNRTTGEMLSKIQDLEKVTDFISTAFSNFLLDILFIVISSIILLITSSKLFGILILFTLIMIVISIMYYKRKMPLYKLHFQKKANYYSCITEIVHGFETVKGLNIENQSMSQLEVLNQDFLHNRQSLEKIQLQEENIKNTIYEIGNIVIIFVSCTFLGKGVFSLGEFVLFFSFYSYFFQPFLQMVEIVHQMNQIKMSIQNINDIINYTVDKPKNSHTNTIEVQVLNKKYSIKKGDKVILLGESGSGKSTILKAIKGYIQSDNIKIGFATNDITYISQEEVLFTDTIQNNILLGSNLEELNKVVMVCEIEPIIQKKKLGLYTLIEENGFNLSGGEKQRIILARSLIKNPKVLLIDEGLGQVNSELERKILSNIMKHYPDMTIIFVSHRTDNQDLFDKVITLKEEYHEKLIYTYDS